MISINGVSVSFSNNYVLNSVTLLINKRDRIGLVGKNGAGKTTLLRVLTGIQQIDGGNVAAPKDLTMGFLPQEILYQGTQSVFRETILAFKKIIDVKDKIKKYEKALEEIKDFDTTEYADIIEKLTQANEVFNLLDGHNIEAETEKILIGLGFTNSQLHQPVSIFSGGWRMRIELAKILLQKPDLLLLDEPTNHLDIESIQWLEDFLIKYHGAVVVVSHDRTFLDNVTTRTIEINFGKVYDYNVPYSKYIEKREERLAQQQSDYESQQKYIEHNEKFIERFRYKSTKAKQVQSRIKMLDKIDLIEVDEIDKSGIKFKFPPAPHSGKVVVSAENLGKSFDGKLVLKDLDFIIDKGDKIAFVGKNGEGKTTLSRIIVGELPYSGFIELGYNVSIGYYAQNETELLNQDKTVFETIDDVAVGDIRTKIRAILGSFLFSGDTIDKKVSVLSGGEKSRLALAKLLLSPCNLLILDEPTNHLDMKAKDILKNALSLYNGTLIIVSHDRHFLQGLTNKVFEFKNNAISQYIGDVFDFLKSRNIEHLKTLEIAVGKEKKTKFEKKHSDNKLDREQRKEKERQFRKLKQIIVKAEEEIAALESRMAEIDILLQDPPQESNPDDYKQLYITYETVKKRHDVLIEEWTEAHKEADTLSASENGI